jgi:molybdopterin converting factor small subunit
MNPMVRVRLPPVLRTVMGGRDEIDGEGATIETVLRNISAAHPGLGLHLFDESGTPRRNIVCLHRGALVRAREFSDHGVAPGDELVMTNALAGG